MPLACSIRTRSNTPPGPRRFPRRGRAPTFRRYPVRASPPPLTSSDRRIRPQNLRPIRAAKPCPAVRRSALQADAGSVFGEQLTHECPLIAQYAARFVADPVGGEELGIMAEACAVALVARQAVEAEKRLGLVAGAFARQEVTVMSPAMQVHQSHPFPGKAFERLDLRRVD